jgi:hypothetical protein
MDNTPNPSSPKSTRGPRSRLSDEERLLRTRASKEKWRTNNPDKCYQGKKHRLQTPEGKAKLAAYRKDLYHRNKAALEAMGWVPRRRRRPPSQSSDEEAPATKSGTTEIHHSDYGFGHEAAAGSCCSSECSTETAEKR